MRRTLSRREFVHAALVSGGSVLFWVGAARAQAKDEPPTAFALNGWIRIAPTGSVSVYSRTTELGQGALTSLALIVAEELCLEAAAVSVEMAPVAEAFMERTAAGESYYATWGSSSSRDMDRHMRKVAATVRALLLQAAADQWHVPVGECRAEAGRVHHVGGRTLSYAALAPLAARLPVPQHIEPLPRAEWRHLGRSAPRLDIPAKVDGSALYGLDVWRPGMRVASIKQCPVFGGTLASVDASVLENMPGISAVVKLENAVAVVAEGYWSAQRGLERLRPLWRAAPRPAADSADQSVLLKNAVGSRSRLCLPAGVSEEQVLKAHASGMSGGALRRAALYEVPFLAHAPMEPMNATAHVTPGGAELWVPTQFQSMVREVIAELLHLPREKVLVHTTAVGGGFGRRTEVDYAIQAVQIAREVAHPVKLIWSREEDTSRGYFRPAAVLALEAAMDAQGEPTAFALTAACPSIMDYSIERRHGVPPAVIEEAGLANARDWPYAVPAQKIALASVDLGVPVTWMRSVGSAAAVFALESFIDEMAAATGRDPLDYRRHLLRNRPRELAVLEKVAALAGCGKPAAAGRHRGFALSLANGSVVAQIVELSVSAQRVVRLHRICCVVDCGAALNPDAVAAQMEGGIIFGLTSALFGEISLKGGAVVQQNFDTYPLLSLAQTPPIDVAILPSDAPIGGVGEEAVPPVAPALANALYLATGERIRSMPFVKHGWRFAAAA